MSPDEKHREFDNAVWETIRDWWQMFNYGPAISELMEIHEVTSKSTIHQSLDRLQRQGRIRRGIRGARALNVVEEG